MRVFVGLIALTEAGKCEDKGGQCVDWRTEVSFIECCHPICHSKAIELELVLKSS